MLDPPTAVIYSEGEHGTPSDEFRALGLNVANALQKNELPAPSALQDPSSQQPNLMAGLMEIYGGKPVRVAEYMESSIREFPFAAVDYTVGCASGEDVRCSLRFNYVDGELVLFPLQQEDMSISASELTDGATPGSTVTAAPDIPSPAAAPSTEVAPPEMMRYPSCLR
ncbi:hypothetical protein ABLG96_07890 [Nakamurella sp. A5-74]|uniref:Uncharacterized protein n=1 Tax=Nakamurella sp. A5-74 TaxID=3158264 RepID=A0AAU8DTZ6_9ACTN